MEKLAEVMKIIEKNHLISLISSFVGSAIVYLLIPSDYWAIEKMQPLSPYAFFLFVAGCFFLVIKLAKHIKVQMTAWKKEKKLRRNKESAILNSSREAKVAWSLVDELTNEQLSCVNSLIKRKNRPVKIRKDIESDNWWKYNNVDVIRKTGQDRYGTYTLYSLGESLYMILSALYRVNGSILRKGKRKPL